MSSLKMLQDLIFETQLSIVQMVPWVILLITHKAPIGLFPTDHIFLFFQELHARFSTVAQSLIINDPPPPKPSTSAITIDYNSSQHKKKISSAVLALLLDNGKLHPEQNMWNQAFLTALNTMSLSRQQGSNMKTTSPSVQNSPKQAAFNLQQCVSGRTCTVTGWNTKAIPCISWTQEHE